MKKRFLMFAIVLMTAAFAPLPAQANGSEGGVDAKQFHPPKAAAEKALDHILTLDNTDRDLPGFIFKTSNRAMARDKDFSPLFTQQLMDAWKKSYNSIPEEEGGGRYVDIDFITCGQDSSDKYLYATIKENKHESYVDIVWPEYADDLVISPSPYRMVKEAGKWKLDGVKCPDGFIFNTDFNYTLPVKNGINSNTFHLPRTEAEEALKNILLLDKNDLNFFWFFLGRPDYEPTKDSGYSRLLTDALLSAARKKEKNLLQKTCGGQYKDGEECGFDYHPLTCGQDTSDYDYLFRTIRINKTEAILTYTWKEFLDRGAPAKGPVYRMVKDQNGWKLDGLICAQDSFNMADAYSARNRR